jgi:hypothetical protein
MSGGRIPTENRGQSTMMVTDFDKKQYLVDVDVIVKFLRSTPLNSDDTDLWFYGLMWLYDRCPYPKPADVMAARRRILTEAECQLEVIEGDDDASA